MNIRNATQTDAASIAAFVSALAAEHIAPSLGDGGLDKLLASMDANATQQRIDDGWPHMCAFDGDDLVGVVVIKPPTHLYHLFVRSALHRTGIGTRLLATADEWSIGSTGTCLATVNSSLNAIDIYKRLGFDLQGPVTDTGGVRCQPMVRQNTS